MESWAGEARNMEAIPLEMQMQISYPNWLWAGSPHRPGAPGRNLAAAEITGL